VGSLRQTRRSDHQHRKQELH